MEILIREHNKNDKDACLIAFRSNVPKYFNTEEIEDYIIFLSEIQNENIEDKKKKNFIFFVVVHNKRVIGCGGFVENKNLISLVWGLIHNDFHKRGIGKKLLLHRLEQIKLLYPGLPLLVDTTQFSCQFFEKFGFSTTKITKDFYTLGMHKYHMALNR